MMRQPGQSLEYTRHRAALSCVLPLQPRQNRLFYRAWIAVVRVIPLSLVPASGRAPTMFLEVWDGATRRLESAHSARLRRASSSPAVGIYAGSKAQPQVDVRFDNFVVTRPS